jgi:hypothetical protein
MFGPAKRYDRSSLLEMRDFNHGRPAALPQVPCKKVEYLVSEMRRSMPGAIAVLPVMRFQSFRRSG